MYAPSDSGKTKQDQGSLEASRQVQESIRCLLSLKDLLDKNFCLKLWRRKGVVPKKSLIPKKQGLLGILTAHEEITAKRGGETYLGKQSKANIILLERGVTTWDVYKTF